MRRGTCLSRSDGTFALSLPAWRAAAAKLEDAPHAYEIFRAKQDGCIKVVLDPWRTDPAISTFQAADNALAESTHSESKEVI